MLSFYATLLFLTIKATSQPASQPVSQLSPFSGNHSQRSMTRWKCVETHIHTPFIIWSSVFLLASAFNYLCMILEEWAGIGNYCNQLLLLLLLLIWFKGAKLKHHTGNIISNEKLSHSLSLFPIPFHAFPVATYSLLLFSFVFLSLWICDLFQGKLYWGIYIGERENAGRNFWLLSLISLSKMFFFVLLCVCVWGSKRKQTVKKLKR